MYNNITEVNTMCTKKTKIVFQIGNMTRSGGTERVLSIIASGLVERGYQVSIVSMWGKDQTFFPLSEKVKLYWVEKEAPQAGVFGKIRAITDILNKENAEFLIDVDIILVFYSLFLKRMRPQMHWISWEHFNYYYHFRKNHNLRKAARRLAARYSEQLVVLSDEDKRYYQEKLKLKCGITRIYNPNPYEGVQEKQTEKSIIFAAGRLTKAKGFDLLIKSWKLLEDKYPEWKVLIAGEGEKRKILEEEKKTAGLKRLLFIGNVSNIEQYYKLSSMFVLPSRDEGFGMVLLEAMDFSLPVVSYSCKAGPSEIVTDGENGFLVEPGQVEVFAEKMELLIQDENMRRQMGRNAAKSTERFKKELILDQWEMLFENMSKHKTVSEG